MSGLHKSISYLQDVIESQRAVRLELEAKCEKLEKERDTLRRALDELANTIDCDACPVDSGVCRPNKCVENIRAWAKQQAEKDGKVGEG